MTTTPDRRACCGERIERPRAGTVYCSDRCRTRALQQRHTLSGADTLDVIGEALREPLCGLTLGDAALEL